VNLKEDNAPIDPAVDTNLIGNVYGTVEGANSVGQAAQTVIAYSIATNTDQPWIQIDQNAHRVNSMELRNDIATPDTVWMANAITFQYTDTEDDR
jgi:predicted ATPase